MSDSQLTGRFPFTEQFAKPKDANKGIIGLHDLKKSFSGLI